MYLHTAITDGGIKAIPSSAADRVETLNEARSVAMVPSTPFLNFKKVKESQQV